MKFAVENATVYRAGRRRYFTKRAACNALVREKLNERCECDYCDHPEMPGAPREDLPCGYHDDSPRAKKITRRLTRLYMQSMKEQSHVQ